MALEEHPIVILDFGSQYTQLVARRVRECQVYCEIYPYDIPAIELEQLKPLGFILSGGPDSAHDQDAPPIPDIVFQIGCPVLGICYGMQRMAYQLGGEVTPCQKREFGHVDLAVIADSPLFNDIADNLTSYGKSTLHVWMSHGDEVSRLPTGFKTLAQTDNADIAAMGDVKRQFYGIQFHPEVTHTKQGKRILERFAKTICRAPDHWQTNRIIEQQIATIRAEVKEEEVVLGLSGGVDSAVAAVLLHRAIGPQLRCVFIDHGLLRFDEANQVMTTFAEGLGIHVTKVDAKDKFLGALQGISDPEQKRKIIGKTFIDVFESESKRYQNATWLAQGTIYSDVIESAGSKKAKLIKSHHNVAGLPKHMRLKLIEPLRTLFKDEVRQLGIALGLPFSWVYRHPFPGPGLAVRILGEVKEEYIHYLRAADKIFLEVLEAQGFYQRVAQAFAVFIPVKSVAVMGDSRRYEYVIALRAVETTDYMTAKASELPYSLLSITSSRIINEVPGISRVTYDISSKPPATIEWE